MKKAILFAFVVAAAFSTSCGTSTKGYSPSGAVVNFEKSDFVFSEKKSTEVTTTRIFGIDFASLFMKKSATVGSPIFNTSMMPLSDKTANKAAYQLLKENPDYDVVFYPKVETEGMSYIIFSTTTSKITGKLGRLK